MPNSDAGQMLSVTVAELLPYLRRYARALSGSQETGDRYAAATLEALSQDRSVFDEGLSHKVALFKAFHAIWVSSGAPSDAEESGITARAQTHLAKLTPNAREVLLLRTIEEFSIEEIAAIPGLNGQEVEPLFSVAIRDMEDRLSGKVMIIEDEAIIALDFEGIVAEMGHKVTGVAPTQKAALRLFGEERPDLILSDIQLADGSSGIDAMNEVLAGSAEVPVIFITAFPERLPTGERPEPAFVINKPCTEEQVRSAVSQAMFFSSIETLTA
ncbi:MAG TPA: response regulator [Rhodobacteraceae bacterium]|nr:response regulator [Paracoccaceae bacterium]